MVLRQASRRRLIAALGAAALASAAIACPPAAGAKALEGLQFAQQAQQPQAQAPRPAALTYRISRDGHDLGRQSVLVRELDGATEVEIATQVQVSVGGMQVYEFAQNVREVWRERRLVSLSARSNDNGARHTVELAPSAGKSLLVVDGKQLEVPAEVATTSLWHPFMLKRPALVDTLHGELAQFKTRDEGEVSIRLGDRDVAARYYVVNGGIKRRLWYALGGDQLLRMAMVARDGSEVLFEVVR